MRNIGYLWVVAWGVLSPCVVQAGRCADLARPAEFTAATAMQAVFCAYNQEHSGLLLPLDRTQAWDVAKAETMVSPLLAATYEEGSAQKGVLALQRQAIQDGELVEGHAAAATISVYVFRKAGARWVFEKGRKELTTAGAHGTAPGARLVRLGDERWGLWFEGGDVHQGYTDDYAFIAFLSEETVYTGETHDTGASNHGTCSDDPKEQALSSLVTPCWGYEIIPSFIREPGSAYYLLRLRSSGSGPVDEEHFEEIVPRNAITCYRWTEGDFAAIEDPKCAERVELPAAETFGAGLSGERARPVPSMPRKLLYPPVPRRN